MAMNNKDFMDALAIVSKYHTTEVLINAPRNGFVGELGRTEYRLHIKKCCAGAVNELIENKFSLSMEEEGMSVDAYARRI